MDRFSEQLISKMATGKDMFLRGLLIAGGMLLIGVLMFFLTGIGALMVGVVLSAGVIWGLVWLLQGTITEYEYIVTNDDLDIDKITGRRKRKRLMTVSLRDGKELSEYVSGSEINADITVMANDETGVDMYCFICGTEKYGDVAIIFNPDKRTIYNMIGGFAPAVKQKYRDLYDSLAPQFAETEDDDNESGAAGGEAESTGTDETTED
ncbi:MAG: hypothetical protein J6N15_01190 [Ruminiclostridium sp.]|nr:hypothetical protein [Ruminiclostridium sp.]